MWNMVILWGKKVKRLLDYERQGRRVELPSAIIIQMLWIFYLQVRYFIQSFFLKRNYSMKRTQKFLSFWSLYGSRGSGFLSQNYNGKSLYHPPPMGWTTYTPNL